AEFPGRREVWPSHRRQFEAQFHSGKDGAQYFRKPGQSCSFVTKLTAKRSQHRGSMGISCVLSVLGSSNTGRQRPAKALVKLDFVGRNGARGNGEGPRSLVWYRHSTGYRVCAMEPRGAAVKAHEAIGVAEGKADHSGLGCRQRKRTRRPEMR